MLRDPKALKETKKKGLNSTLKPHTYQEKDLVKALEMLGLKKWDARKSTAREYAK